MSEIIIRSVSHKDLSSLLLLMDQFGHPINKQDLLQNIELFLYDDRKIAWVAEKDQKVVGLIAIEIIDLFHTKEKLARVVTLVIDKEYRREGIASSLLEKAIELVKKLSCLSMELVCEEKSEAANNFCKKMQFDDKSSTLYLKKSL